MIMEERSTSSDRNTASRSMLDQPGNCQTPSPSRLKLLRSIWTSREDFDDTNSHGDSATVELHSPGAQVEKKEAEVTLKPKKRGFFSMRTRKKNENDVLKGIESSLTDKKDQNQLNFSKSTDIDFHLNEYNASDFHCIKMSPMDNNLSHTDNESTFSANSESELSSEIITTLSPRKNVSVEQQTRPPTVYHDTEERVPCSKASNSVHTITGEPSNLISLYVGDLDKSITELELHKFFHKSKGLVSVKIPRNALNGESLGYGYVNFDNQKAADNAVEQLNYTKLGDSEVRIMPSIRDKAERERTGANIFFSNLPVGLTTRVLYDKFKKSGKILSCKYNKEKNTCFINFANKLDAYRVCKQYNKTEMNGQTIFVGVHIMKQDRVSFQGTKLNPELHRIATSEIKPYRNDINCLSLNSALSTDTGASISISDTMTRPTPDSLSMNFKIVKVDSDVASTLTEPLSRPNNETKESKVSTQYSIFIRNLPLSIKDEIIKGLVEQYGKVTSVLSRKVPSKKGTWALVTLTNNDSVERAVFELNSIQVEGKQLFVTRAIPREQKAYARKENSQLKKRRKILVSGINLTNNKYQLEEWCRQYDSIKSIELYGTCQGGDNVNTIYGYIEIDSENDANELIDKLKSLDISCYKVLIELPNKEANFEVPKYSYMSPMNKPYEINRNSAPISFSYVNPNKMYQIAGFNNNINFDKLNMLNRRESFNRKRSYASACSTTTSNYNNNNVDTVTAINNYSAKTKEENEEYHNEIMNNINSIIWELAVRMFSPNQNANSATIKSVNKNEILNKNKVSSLTEHMVKFFWAKNVEELYQFLKINQFDQLGNVILPAHPLIEKQLIQSARYLGIVPKQWN